MASGRSDTSRSRSRSRSPRRQKVHSKRVVIANIPYDVTWNKLKQIFRDRVGFTGFLRLMKSNGRPNGMGVMEFKTIEGAEKAIELMHRFEISDRKIIVREETLRDQERMAQMEFDGPSGNEVGPSGGGGQHGPIGGPAVAAMSTVTPMMLERMGIRGPITDSLYVSNLDYRVDWKKIKDVFKLAGRVIHASIKQHEDGRSRGVAVVRFEHPYEALLAYTMFNGQVINDRPIRVKVDREGTPAPPNLPIFPPTAGGAAAAASFMAHLSKMGGGAAGFGSCNSNFASFGGPVMGSGMCNGSLPFIPGVMPHQSEAAAAAMAAFLGGGGSGMPSNLPVPGASVAPYNSVGNGPFRGGNQTTPSPSAEILNGMLGPQCGLPPLSNVNPMVGIGGPRGGPGFQMQSVTPGIKQLNHLMGLQGCGQSGYNGGMNLGLGGSDPRGMGAPSRDQMGSLQQLLMAAAAGGMSQEQIANAAASLGLANRDDAMGSHFQGVNDSMPSGDRYGDRRMNGNKPGGPSQHDMHLRRPPRSDYDGPQMMPGHSMTEGAANTNSLRGYPRPQQSQQRGDPSNRPGLRDQRIDGARVYMKRPGNYAN